MSQCLSFGWMTVRDATRQAFDCTDSPPHPHPSPTTLSPKQTYSPMGEEEAKSWQADVQKKQHGNTDAQCKCGVKAKQYVAAPLNSLIVTGSIQLEKSCTGLRKILNIMDMLCREYLAERVDKVSELSEIKFSWAST